MPGAHARRDQAGRYLVRLGIERLVRQLPVGEDQRNLVGNAGRSRFKNIGEHLGMY